jgi:hypothetical protein
MYLRLLGSALSCSSKLGIEECDAIGGSCNTVINGFYITSILCIMFGAVSYMTMKRRLLPLQYAPVSSWLTGYDPEIGIASYEIGNKILEISLIPTIY